MGTKIPFLIFFIFLLSFTSGCTSENYDGDNDDDGLLNSEDNCPNVYNPEQEDLNGNGIGSVCDVFTVVYEDFGSPYKIIPSLDNRGHVTAGMYSGEDNRDVFVALFDTSAKLLWKTIINDTEYDVLTDLVSDGESYIVSGYYFPKVPESHALVKTTSWIRKLDLDGNIIWSREYADLIDFEFRALGVNSEGNYLVAAALPPFCGNDNGYGIFLTLDSETGDVISSVTILELEGYFIYDMSLTIAQSEKVGIIFSGYNDNSFSEEMYFHGFTLLAKDGTIISEELLISKNTAKTFAIASKDDYFIISGREDSRNSLTVVTDDEDIPPCKVLYPKQDGEDEDFSYFKSLLLQDGNVIVSQNSWDPSLTKLSAPLFFHQIAVGSCAPSIPTIWRSEIAPTDTDYCVPDIMDTRRSSENGYTSVMRNISCPSSSNDFWISQVSSDGRKAKTLTIYP